MRFETHSYVPLTSALKQAVLTLDVNTANAEVGNWLRNVANQRVHPLTKQAPTALFEAEERVTLQALPQFARAPEQGY